MLRSLRIVAILGICVLALCLVARIASASIPGAPTWGSDYQLVFSQDYTAMSTLSQVGISSGTSIGAGQTWAPTRIPASLNWAPFIAPNGNYDPFGVGSGYLDIRAQQNLGTSNGFDGYSCGLLESMDASGDGFAQEYGYFEASMQTPGGANTWPGFWLLDKNGLTGESSDSVEFDITESYGNWGTGPGQNPAGNPDEDAVTWHWWNNSNNPSNGVAVQESGMTTGYHTYGVDIEPSGVTYYFDRNPIWNVPASQLPSTNLLDRAFYVLLDLALGGGNFNNSTNTGYDYSLTPNPSDLKVQYVAVWASPASPNFSGPPAAPTNLAATPGNQVVALSWSSSTGAATYNVYRGTSPGGEGGTAIATGVTSTSYADTGLSNGTTYYYKVASVDSQGTSSLSNEASAAPRAGVPLTPSGLKVAQGNTQLTLSWSSSPDSTSYDIYRGNAAGSEGSTPVATGVTGTTYTDTSLSNGTPYFYYVEGVDSYGNSAASNEANAIPAVPDGSCPVELAPSSPPIDGTDSSAWSGANVLPINNLNLGSPTTTNGTFATMWDSSYLYVLFTVDANTIVDGTPDYNGSAVEFYIDTNNSKSGSNGPSDFRYSLGFDHTSINEDNQGATTGVKFAQSTYPGGYREEIAIPWSTLGVTPWSGQSIGLDAAIDDSDNASEGRTAQLFWYNTTASDYYNPSGFGNGTLDPASPAPPAPGTYELVNVNSGLAMEVPGGNNTVGTVLDQASYTGATYQQWAVTPGFSGGYYLQNVSTSQVADTGPSFTDSNIDEWTANSIPDNDTTQLYTLVKLGSYYQITGIWSGRVLDVSGSSTSSGASIIQNNAAQSDNSQLWNLVLVSGGAPGTPTGLAATAGNAQVTLNWTASAGATSYNVYRGTSPGGESGTPVATGVTGTSYTNTGLTNGTTYYYEVAAVNSAGTSSKSNEASATPSAGGGAPSPPNGLSATGGSAQVSLSWSSSTGATSYNIYRGTSAGGEGGTPIATGVSTTSYTNTGLSAGTTYYYKVTAVNSGGESGKSNEASATTTPPAPTSLAATAGDTQISLTWSASSGATSYNVYRGTTSGGESGTPVASGVTGTSFTDTGLTNGTTYYYKVAAVNAAGTSSQSNEASATPESTVPAAPTSLTASGGNGSVALAWTGSAGATSYNVYRGTSSGGESTTALATGITATTYTDTSVTNGTTYYYKVAAVNAAGTSSKSNEASATPSSGSNGTPVLQIDSGGPTVGSWLVDQDVVAGTPSGTAGTSSGITTTGLSNPPPQQVLQSVHYGNFSYVLPGFTPGASYTVKMYFVETWWTGSGEREFNVAINGTQVLTDFDIFATAGGENIAVMKAFNAIADGNGNITVQFTNVVDNSEISGIEVDTGSTQSAPSAPTGLTATAGNAQVGLSWTASSGATSYNVYRGTSSGGEGSTPIASVMGASYTDTGLTNGTKYYYEVKAVNSAGSSGNSNEASATPSSGSSGTPVLQIDCGGPTEGSWLVDQDVSGGGTTGTSSTIDTSQLRTAPPQEVLQTVHYGNFTYTLPGFTANAAYTVKMYFVETWWTGPGEREFNVAINGSPVLSDFDIFATAGGENIAICRSFQTTANSSGDIVVQFTNDIDNSEVSGIEVDTGSTTAVPAVPTGLTASAGIGSVGLSWSASSGAASYNVYRGTTSGGESATPIATNVNGTSYTDSSVTNGTTYYYMVAAVNSSGVSGYSNQASATPSSGTPVVEINCGGPVEGSWAADEDVTGGSPAGTSATISTSGVANPAPEAVYQQVHVGTSFTYTIPGLTPNATYTVRLHFAEIYWTSAGEREFNVAINGNSVLSDFDIFAAAGGENIAIAEPFTATANSSGDITIAFTQGPDDDPCVNGIEIDGT